MKKHNRVGTILNVTLILLIGMVIGTALTLYRGNRLVPLFQQVDASKYLKFDLIDQMLASEYLDPEALSWAQEAMRENALKAYVAGLDDPYTNYLTKEENTELVNVLRDETGIEGIGAVVEKRDNYIQIEEVIKNWPAYKAGLQPLDRIFFIDTGSTQDLTVSEAVSQIRGEKGTEVKLFIQRAEKNGTTKEFRQTITRDSIEIPSVVAELVEEKGKKIWLFEISSISEHTTKLFINELVNFMNEGMDGLILDLRGNGGGYLEEAAKFLGHFIPKGEIVTKSEYQAFDPIDLKSEGRGELANMPTVIIIDQLTASAGEIIALALQERGVPVIGMQSFGKGTIQTFTELADGSSLKYTIGKRFSPNHVTINGTGMTPNIEVEWDYETYKEKGFDNQLEEAKKVVRKLIE